MLEKMGLADHPQEPWSGVAVTFAVAFPVRIGCSLE